MKIEKITKNWDIVEKYKCKSEKEFTPKQVNRKRSERWMGTYEDKQMLKHKRVYDEIYEEEYYVA